MTQPDVSWGDPTQLFAASPSDLVTVGGLWYAPYGTPLPEDVDEPLDPAFKNLGYIGVDGVTVTINDETVPIEVWGGDEVGQLRDSFSIEYEVPLFQVLSPIVNAAIFGEDAVSTTPANAQHGNRMRVLINNKLPKRCSLVLDSVYEDKMIRQVAAIAQKSGIGEINLVHNEPMTFTPTFKVLKNTDGNHVVQYSDDGQLVGSV
ncbi:putative major tail protein [Mycobacterium phage Y10]|uniref:Major tail protein n=4 Tax=Fionnbharthvirus fionnbharth TaxID=2955891 RepID=A0A1J0MDI8_9CAUD|nr:major tail protein [Mycobacterium phage Fionnbharth]YP_009215618.1 major tail protein [Mycobacterium phage Cheetobro]ALA46291.1 major tail protein [Mycobacterium phage Slarp]APD19153.1 major tail protein [Mycobacterium phage Mitti]ASR87727.1 major tail protein [Mycobacterium phage Wintermute]ASW31670.1 major tail protein [Mycobacterium phage Chancellor]AVR77336.1 major tail protein [Mycobacterium phage SamScheppers]QJD52315.1 major tail protein [Mycobacterium phage JF1]UUG69710.1 major t